ncbi:Ribosome-releasing factor 2, mitochondrial [Blastocladiella emersonii ATCC 22665]|nr:Ribosome-releasing factor 2, mitochondrial [Blastocladiella emersonii ATCC 22665]
MLHFAGYTKRIGNVDEGSTVMDYLPQERERGITIQSAAITFGWALKPWTPGTPPPPPPPPETTDSSVAGTRAAPVPFKLNLIDTPGHVDFTFEVERSLRVLDGAVCVLDGVAGVEAQTATVWAQANRYRVPRIVFVNKMDRAGASLDRAVAGLRSRLTGWGPPLVTQLPVFAGDVMTMQGSGLVAVLDVVDMVRLEWSADPATSGSEGARVTASAVSDPADIAAVTAARAHLVEALSESSDAVLDALLELEDPMAVPAPLIHAALRAATLNGAGVPVLVGASFRNIGVQPVLDAALRYLPSPRDRPPVPARVAGTDREVMVRLEDQPLCALAFKVVYDSKRGYMTYVRVYSGTVSAKQQVVNATQGLGAKERVNKILLMYANDAEEIESLSAGNIGVLLGLKDTRTGDSLANATGGAPPLVLAGLPIPAPVFTCSVEPTSSAHAKDLDTALAHLVREDPSVHVREDPETGQLLLAGQGELHMDILRDRLLREHRVPATVGDVQIAYRESLAGTAEFVDDYVPHVISAAGSAAAAPPAPVRVGVSVAPLPPARDDGLLPSDAGVAVAVEVPGLDAETKHHVERAARAALAAGPLRAAPMTHVQVTVHTLGKAAAEGEPAVTAAKGKRGSPSTPAASVPAGPASAATHWAVTRALRSASPVTVHPIMRLRVVVPSARVGDVLRDLNRRGARVGHVGIAGDDAASGRADTQEVTAQVPLAAMVGYAKALRSLTAGAASMEMSMDGYDVV